jgi:hypothetical protein
MASPKIRRQPEKVMRDWRGIKAAIGDRVFYVRMTPPTGRWHQTLPSLPSAATGDISVSVILPPFHWRSREHPLVAVAGLDMEQRLAAPTAAGSLDGAGGMAV